MKSLPRVAVVRPQAEQRPEAALSAVVHQPAAELSPVVAEFSVVAHRAVRPVAEVAVVLGVVVAARRLT